jgi:hypothetical protein
MWSPFGHSPPSPPLPTNSGSSSGDGCRPQERIPRFAEEEPEAVMVRIARRSRSRVEGRPWRWEGWIVLRRCYRCKERASWSWWWNGVRRNRTPWRVGASWPGSWPSPIQSIQREPMDSFDLLLPNYFFSFAICCFWTWIHWISVLMCSYLFMFSVICSLSENRCLEVQ